MTPVTWREGFLSAICPLRIWRRRIWKSCSGHMGKYRVSTQCTYPKSYLAELKNKSVWCLSLSLLMKMDVWKCQVRIVIGVKPPSKNMDSAVWVRTIFPKQTSKQTKQSSSRIMFSYVKLFLFAALSLFRGYGFVQFERTEDAEAAKAGHNGRIYRGYKLGKTIPRITPHCALNLPHVSCLLTGLYLAIAHRAYVLSWFQSQACCPV